MLSHILHTLYYVSCIQKRVIVSSSHLSQKYEFIIAHLGWIVKPETMKISKAKG